ncbi:MAG: hypothetical protein J2P53_07105 [Bradyrhizobiaceae bacterium]|nr:hypothetical protein [Bradyrhizobiaceae bacterium]
MLMAARILARASLLSTTACAVVLVGGGCFDAVRLISSSSGFDTVLFFGGLFFNIAALTGFPALAAAIVGAVLRKKGGNLQIALTSAASLLVIGAVFAFIEPLGSNQSACRWFLATDPPRKPRAIADQPASGSSLEKPQGPI